MSLSVCFSLHLLFCSHEKPHDPDDPLNKQNVKDRFEGRNDPVAAKILERVKREQRDYEREKREVSLEIIIVIHREQSVIWNLKVVLITTLSNH